MKPMDIEAMSKAKLLLKFMTEGSAELDEQLRSDYTETLNI